MPLCSPSPRLEREARSTSERAGRQGRWIPLHGWIKSKAGRRTGVFLFASFASFAFRARCSSSFTRRGCSSSTSISFGAMSQIVSTLIRSASQPLMVGTIAFLIGCGGPDFVQDPLDYLGVGVNPREEAERVAHQLGKAGYVVDRQIEGAGAIALEARRLRDGATAVRIITSRGIALAVDAPDRRHPARRSVGLGERPLFERRPSDGLSLLPIHVQMDERLCIAAILFDGEGFIRELTRDENPYMNEGCYPEPEAEAKSSGAAEEEAFLCVEGFCDASGLPLDLSREAFQPEPVIDDGEFVIGPDES